MGLIKEDRRFWAAFAALGALSLALRIAPCFDAFWLDEVFSHNDAMAATSLLDLFDRIYRINSHCVTNLWIYLVGETPRWWLYRLPSLIAGCLLVGLAAWPLRRRAGDAAALAAAALFGGSFFLVTYASEARAYGGVMLHALLTFRLLEAWEERPSPAREWAVAASLIGGAFWQPIFLLVWGAVTLWALAARLPAPSLLRMLALPWAALAALAAVSITVQTSAPAHVRPRLDVLQDFFTAGFGLRGPPALRLLVAAGLAAAFAASFFPRPAFETRRIALLRLLLCVVPVAGVLAAPAESIFERYFASALPFLYLSVLYGILAWAPPRPDRAHLAAWALGLAVLTGNGLAMRDFLRDGRGHYLEALRWMAERSPQGEKIRLISDHPFRNGTLVRFYARYLPGTRFEHISHTDMGGRPAPWALIHQVEDDEYAAPPREIAVEPHGYRLVRTFAKSGLSGFRWHLYALTPPPDESQALRN